MALADELPDEAVEAFKRTLLTKAQAQQGKPVTQLRVKVEAQFPWSTRRRKHRQVMVRVRVYARSRWRWWCVLLSWPVDTMSREGRVQSVTLEAKSWLTDESMRGNLRHKAFVRWHFKAGMGGVPQTGRYCPVLSGKGRRCTWERGHVPMIVDYAGSPVQGVYAHSWQAKLGPKATVVQEPRRRHTSAG